MTLQLEQLMRLENWEKLLNLQRPDGNAEVDRQNNSMSELKRKRAPYLKIQQQDGRLR